MPAETGGREPSGQQDRKRVADPYQALHDLPSEPREALLRTLIASAPDGLIVIHAGGRIALFNPAAEAMFGYPAEEVIGRNVGQLMPALDASQHDRHVARYLETGEQRIIGTSREVFAERKDGSVFPVHLTVSEVPLEGGSLFVGFVRDVSTRHEAAQRLHELQSELFHVSRLSAMGEMASALAHELNQPLTAITNYAQATHRLVRARGLPGFERILDLLDKTVQQASRAGQIIHRLREFMAKGETERTREQVNRVVEEASSLALIGSARRGIHARFAFGTGLPPVEVDKIQLTQVLTNLLRNSIDALETHDGPRDIRLETRAVDGNWIEISVADSGPGLAPEVRAHLFEPFVTTKPGGMGIGLSICRSIVEVHGGTLTADPENGTGTCFRVRLPVARNDDGRRR